MFKQLTPLLALALALLPLADSGAANVFFADFESSVDQAAGNTTAANLNAGTTGTGVTWVLNAVDDTRVRSDGGGSGTRVFNPDNGPYDWDITFSSASPLENLELSYDAYHQRTETASNTKKNFLTGYDSDGDEVFSVFLTQNGAQPTAQRGRLSYVNASGTNIALVDGLNSQSNSNFDDSRLQNFRLEFNATGYQIFVDNASVIANAEYRNTVGNGAGEIDGLAMISFTSVPGASNSAGAFYDNLSLDVIPEPSSAALLAGLGALGLVVRRRR